VAFKKLRHGHAGGLGIADLAVLGDERGKRELGSPNVCRAEAISPLTKSGLADSLRS
jgi:hypothetical protein